MAPPPPMLKHMGGGGGGGRRSLHPPHMSSSPPGTLHHHLHHHLTPTSSTDPRLSVKLNGAAVGAARPPPPQPSVILGGNGSPGGTPTLDHPTLIASQRDKYANTTLPLTVKVNGVAGGRHQHHPSLNMSTLSSKHSVGGNSGSGSPGTTTVTRTTLDHSRDHSHLTDLSHLSHLSPIPPPDVSKATISSKVTGGLVPRFITLTRTTGSKGALTSLGLLCLTSLLLALLALTFLVELTPLPRDADSVAEVTLALAALTLSLDLSCLLICAAQFIFAVKLAKSPNGEDRMIKYLRQSSVSRVCAVGGFFISVPIFLTGVILYTFVHFQSTPAILTSVFIGVGIIFCGCAMIHNVFIWQKQKTKAVAQQNIQQAVSQEGRLRDMNASPLPNATLDLSGAAPPHELSTLV